MTPATEFEARFLSGRELYGDDFSPAELDEWFESEREGYANLKSRTTPANTATTRYIYHALNAWHGFRHLPEGRRFRHALGVGSAYGTEFEPLAPRIDRLTILEPSDRLTVPRIGSLTPEYVKPDPSGTMPFPDGTFDLVLCLGTLHHIPNVTHVVAEFGRVLEPGGYALIREPIVSMGDWRTPRPGCTARERGIPLAILAAAIEGAGLTIRSRSFSGFPLTARLGPALGRATFSSTPMTVLDATLSRAARPLYRYHAESRWRKLRPTSAFFVAERPSTHTGPGGGASAPGFGRRGRPRRGPRPAFGVRQSATGGSGSSKTPGLASRWYLRIRSKALRLVLPRLLRPERRTDLLRLGAPGADWVVPRQLIPPGALCYCVGLGEDGSFDLELRRRFDADVHVFDPTPRSAVYAASTFAGVDGIMFHPIGVWSTETTLKFYAPRDPLHVSHSILNLQRTSEYFEAPCKPVATIMQELGHDRLDLLKLDIEGAEHEVLRTLSRDHIAPTVLCVEFDQPMPTRKVLRTIRHLKHTGYTLVTIDAWNYTFRLAHPSDRR